MFSGGSKFFFFFFFCRAEELEDSALPSSPAESRSVLQEHVSRAAVEPTAPDTRSDSGVAPAETSLPCTESADLQRLGSPSSGVLSLQEEPPQLPGEDPPPADPIPTLAADEEENRQVFGDSKASVCESAEPVDHQNGEESSEKNTF